MPIDYSKYPSNWKTEIRPAILERDGHKCKFCGVPNHAYGHRALDGSFISDQDIADYFDRYELDGDPDEQWEQWFGDDDTPKRIRIVLTIAHLYDHNPMNCDDDNLAALCQKCHNNHDIEHRRKNAAITRGRKEAEKQRLNGQLSLFGEDYDSDT